MTLYDKGGSYFRSLAVVRVLAAIAPCVCGAGAIGCSGSDAASDVTDAGSVGQVDLASAPDLAPDYRPAVEPVGPPVAVVALGGNGFVTTSTDSPTAQIADTGLSGWSDSAEVVSVYFYFSKAGPLSLALALSLDPGAHSLVRVSVLDQTAHLIFDGSGSRSFAIADAEVPQPGYVRVDLQGVQRATDSFASVASLELRGAAAAGAIYANDPANYYWSRRGPSVHLGYTVPAQTQYFYNELTVPVGQDPPGSYFMSNGFDTSYFGMQVKSPTERWMLFSVWDPPKDQCQSTRTGPGVVAQRFGGEGTGGQSYMVFPWQAGRTYGFLSKAEMDMQGGTTFSAWFHAPEDGKWHFMASWRRPSTQGWLAGAYSFVENFLADDGFRQRIVSVGPAWAYAGAQWTEITRAYFDGDATANKNQRLDYDGGVDGSLFYLKNGGFFSKHAPLNKTIQRPALGQPPVIAFGQLP